MVTVPGLGHGVPVCGFSYPTIAICSQNGQNISLSRPWLSCPVEWKTGYYAIKKQIIIQILILNTAFYIYGIMRLKDKSILNLFEQIQENTISGSAFSARLGSSAVAFIPDQIMVSVTDLGHRVPVCGFHTRPVPIFRVNMIV